MQEFDPSKGVSRGNIERLASLMRLDVNTPDGWREHELPAMLRHQLAAPLDSDLKSDDMDEVAAKTRNKSLTSAARDRIKTFKELLFHHQPPLSLLILSKDFFKKRFKNSPKGSPEWKISHLFYVLSILAAGSGLSEVSALPEIELAKSIRWALDEKWVDEKTKSLIRRASLRFET